MGSIDQPGIGIVIVTFNAETVIQDCLRSLHQSDYPDLKIVIVDNASTDDTPDAIRRWANDKLTLMELAAPCVHCAMPGPIDLVLVRSDVNSGFAAGVNTGLRLLINQPTLDLFWILNPDCQVKPQTAANYARRAVEAGTFGLMGGRTLYMNPKDTIQSDGGKLNRWTGMCHNIGSARPASKTPFPDESDFDYIPGSNIVASRAFIEAVGVMDERYFLYFEEVDWAFGRGAFSLVYAPGALVEHHGGSSIGSPVLGKRQGTSFSNYFNYRSRMRFMRRFFPCRLPVAYIYSLLKVVRLVMLGFYDEAHGAFRGLHDLPPPTNVRRRLSDEAARVAFEE